jgi:hypothetical protein
LIHLTLKKAYRPNKIQTFFEQQQNKTIQCCVVLTETRTQDDQEIELKVRVKMIFARNFQTVVAEAANGILT